MSTEHDKRSLKKLRRMVLGFGLPELRELMGFEGRSKDGRLEHLQRSALELVQVNKRPTHGKIIQLHRLLTAATGASIPRRSTIIPFFRGSSPCSNIQLRRPTQTLSHQIRINFKQSPFYEVLAELLKPSTIVPAVFWPNHETEYSFVLTPQQANDIANSRSSEGNQFQTQIHLRFCLVDENCELQDDNFPVNIRLKINGKHYSFPKAPKVPGEVPCIRRRVIRPIDITPLINLTALPSTGHQLTVNWQTNVLAKYAVAVYLIRKLTPAQVMDKFKSKAIPPRDNTKDTIGDKKKELGADSKVSLVKLKDGSWEHRKNVIEAARGGFKTVTDASKVIEVINIEED